MISLAKSVNIAKEIRDYIIPLTDEELALLEKSIMQKGCLDPLVVWEKRKDHLVLVDGHNRFKICQKHQISFKIRKMAFHDIEEVRIWMVENQMGRRNLTPDQMSYYRGLKYLSLKKKKGGYDNVKSKGQNETSTSEILAVNFSVSESTIKRDARYAEGLSIIGKSNPKLKLKILTGETKIKKSDVQILGNAKNPLNLIIKNEADLFNKAKLIRDHIVSDVATKIERIEKYSAERVNQEPTFLNKDDKLRRIKGMILSAINKAIKEKDFQAIKELRKLIDQLSDVLFE